MTLLTSEANKIRNELASEIQARVVGDSNLQDLLATEQQSRINSISQEAQLRASSDLQNQQAIAQEQANRIQADTELRNLVYSAGITGESGSSTFEKPVFGPIALFSNTIAENYTIPSGKNGLAISPTIENNITVTVENGSTFVIL